MGSFPLTRGKHLLEREGVIGAGLIPAHAGKTRPARRLSSPSWAHPRSRGENVRRLGLTTADNGSSPLTRGKLALLASEENRVGLIPAHAGKTGLPPRNRPSPRAHPRSRGENAKKGHTMTLTHGSSPLTRGKLADGHCASPSCGLIPAHAGKTRYRRGGWLCGRAHPRSRGEN